MAMRRATIRQAARVMIVRSERVTAAPERRRHMIVAIGVALAVASLDQATKFIALQTLSETERIPLLGDALGLQLAFNAGTVLSLGSESTWIFTIVGAAAMVVFAVLSRRAPTISLAIGLGVLWGGAAGNLWDRLVAPPGFGVGHVTDFLAYGTLFIGNLADVAIAVGVGSVALLTVLRDRRSQETDPS